MTEEENKIVEIYKIKYDCYDKREAIKHMIRSFNGSVDIKHKDFAFEQFLDEDCIKKDERRKTTSRRIKR